MPGDKEIARRSVELQRRGRDVPLVNIPGYTEWSKARIAEGVSEALIAHLDATTMWLLPEDVESVSPADFDDMLNDLRSGIEDAD